MRYHKKPVQKPALVSAIVSTNQDVLTLGMLYIVEVRLVSASSGELIKHRLLLVGCEHADIERKIRWIFDAREYSQISIKGIEKVREKVHFLTTTINRANVTAGPVIERDDGTKTISQNFGAQTADEPYDPKLFAIGLTTTMLAKDQEHALRKLGSALISKASTGKSHSGPNLSADSMITIEEIALKSGYATARDVSSEANQAHFVRG